MRLVTFDVRSSPGAPRLGVLRPTGESVIDLAAAAASTGNEAPPHLRDMLAFLDAGSLGRDAVEQTAAFADRQQPPGTIHRRDDVTLLAPLPRPRSLRDCMAFERHVIQFMRATVRRRSPPLAAADAWLERACGRGWLRPPRVWYQRPIYYKGNPGSVIGPDADIRWPAASAWLDYELEFAVIIGRPGRDIPKARAMDHVAGYTIFNDVSARDVQLAEMRGHLGLSQGKDLDTGTVLGPTLVTADEIADPQTLAMSARIDGQEWSRGTSADMRYSVAELIAFISRDETLYPGDVIGSGAVGGGCGFELGRRLAPGNIIELEVERLGTLRNRIVRSVG